jgi:hypothetical protein
VKIGIILDVEASRAIRQAEVGASKTMIERTQERFGITEWLAAIPPTVQERISTGFRGKDIAPHIPVIDKSKRGDGIFGQEDFTFDKDRNASVGGAAGKSRGNRG